MDAPIVIETGSRPDTSILWLHGLGADGHDFEPIVPELRLPESLSVRFVFPHAPYRPVTLNGGYTMRAWYDLAMAPKGIHQDEGHIRESERVIAQLIDRERTAGVDSRRIVLAGFSQGAAMALHTGLRYPQPLAGILALSMPLPLAEKIPGEINPANARVPVFLAHGTRDPIVPFLLGERAQVLLGSLGIPVEWHAYNMEHTLNAQEVMGIRAWLVRILAS